MLPIQQGMLPPVRVGLVLGAGGLTGHAFHLGALCALQELTGFDGRAADVLVGTSAGSIVAAGLAGGLSVQDLTAEMVGDALSAEGARIRNGARGQALAVEALHVPPSSRVAPLAPGVLLAAARHPLRVRPAAVVSGLLPAGTQSTEPIARGIRYLHGLSWPERDLRICAVRARDARRVVFGTPGAPETDVGTAVAASCAIPAYFAPVRIGGDTYVDGGMHRPTNADAVLRDQLDLVVVSSPMSAGPRPGPRADLAVRLTMRRWLAAEVRRLRRSGATVVVLQPTARDLDVMGVNPMQAARSEDILASVSASVRARLEAQPSLVGLLQR